MRLSGMNHLREIERQKKRTAHLVTVIALLFSLNGETRMAPESSQRHPLSPRHAFVVQCRTETDIEAGHLAGRVEHIVTGQATSFESSDTLLAFIIQVLQEMQETEAQDP